MKRIELKPTANFTATLIGDPDGFFSPTPFETKRRAELLASNLEGANLMDFEEMQAMMQEVPIITRKISRERFTTGIVRCFWTEIGWNEFGENIFRQAKKLGLNPFVVETDISSIYEDTYQAVEWLEN